MLRSPTGFLALLGATCAQLTNMRTNRAPVRRALVWRRVGLGPSEVVGVENRSRKRPIRVGE